MRLTSALLLVVTQVLLSQQPRPLERASAPNNLTNPALPPWTPAVLEMLKSPPGTRISILAAGIGNARMMAVSESGTVYVTRRMTGDLLLLRDVDNNGFAELRAIVARDLPFLNGVTIHRGIIYLATDRHVYSAPLGREDGTPLALKRIISDLPDAGQHPNRTLEVGPDNRLYVSIGSTCNACRETNPMSATIQKFALDGSSRSTVAEGLRNTIGFGWHPHTGQLWGMDHGSDSRGDDVPPEELNRIEQGAHYGWPWCFADRQVDRLIAQPPPGMTREQFCAMTKGPALTYQAHSAPMQLAFAPARGPWASGDAFVPMRGSWNRAEPVGYKVVRIRFGGGQPTAIEDFVTGWLSSDGLTAWGRPAGLAFDKTGAMLVSDDHHGIIYRIEQR